MNKLLHTTSRLDHGKVSVGTIIITALISILLTLGIVAIVLSQYGIEQVATEVSPFVDNAKNRLTEGVVPPDLRKEPQTEADQIMDGVAINQGSSVLIYSEADEFLGRGVIVTSNGYIITDASLINASSTYTVTVPGTKDGFTTSFIKFDGKIAVLKIEHSTTLVAMFGNNLPSVNDLVVAISGGEKMSIGTGIITSLTTNDITTNIYGSVTPGTLLVAKTGFALGISLTGNQKPNEPSFKLLTKTDIDRLVESGDTN